ncbi:MAG: molecular chaperone HtpG, partial [Muribaculaceae bacterium]|nr:molecular chaperone HtpG [Muribaculaceae bacterium]
VAEKLDKMFKDDRKNFEEKWDDIKVFIEYGMLTDEKFFDSAKKFFLLKDVNGAYYTLEEYNKLVEAEQTDKDNNVIYLYATDATSQYTYIKAAEEKGYNVLLMDGQLDNHIIGLLEQKLDKVRFVRVDADIPERLIVKSDTKDAGLTPLQTDVMSTVIRSQIPEVEKAQFIVSFAALRPDDAPATITQNEFMRRMKEMAAMQPGGGFYGQMPDNYELIVNTEQPVVKKIIELATSSLENEVAPIRSEIETLNNEISAARKEATDKKEAAPDMTEKENKVADLRKKEEDIIKKYASEQPKVRQIVDLALLQSHLLKGESLNEFIKRSVALLS